MEVTGLGSMSPRAWTYLFLLLSASDLLVTWLVISFWGATEINPVANYLLGYWGTWGLAILKVTMVGIVMWAGLLLYRRSEAVFRRVMAFSVAVTAFPLVWTLCHALHYLWIVSWKPS